jgi:hypothetical protein
VQAALKKLLSDSDVVVKADVAPLIKTVVATNKFEKEMAALFGGGSLDDEEDGVQVCECNVAIALMATKCHLLG